MNKKCSKCKLIKSSNEFFKKSKAYDGLNPSCKQCEKKYKRDYYNKNRNLIQDNNKRYLKNNKEKMSEYKREWQKLNNKHRNESLKNRYKNDSNYRLAVLLRTRINRAIKNN